MKATRKPPRAEDVVVIPANVSIADVLAEAASESERLGQLDDELRGIIVNIELRLRAAVNTSLTVDIDADTSLSFCKHKGKWCFVIETDKSETPLVGASRDTRVSVFTGGHVERLVRESAQSVRDQIQDRGVAIESARNLMLELPSESSS